MEDGGWRMKVEKKESISTFSAPDKGEKKTKICARRLINLSLHQKEE